MNLTEAIHSAVHHAIRQQSAAWMLATVSAVNTDGTVDVQTATGTISAVRRLRHFAAPAVNDVVQLHRNADGNWLVTGATATNNPAWQPLSLSSGWSPSSGYFTPAVRLNGDGTAVMCGAAMMSGTLSSGQTIATLPSGTYPASSVRVTVQVAVGYFGVMTISNSGAVTLGDFSATLPTTGTKLAEFDGFRYRLQ